MCNVEGCSSALQALKLARRIGLTSELKFTFILDSYRVVLLRYYALRTKLLVLKKSS
jgi:hypothetical protein